MRSIKTKAVELSMPGVARNRTMYADKEVIVWK